MRDIEIPPLLPPRHLWLGGLLGFVYGIVCRLLIHLDLGGEWFTPMLVAFLCVVPMVIGYLTVVTHPDPGLGFRMLVPWIPTSLAALAALLLFWEGAICIILGAPILLVSASIGGLIGGWIGRRRARAAVLAMLLPFGVGPLESLLPNPTAYREVVSSIVIDASPAAVWREIVSVREITPEELPPALYLRMGFPRPLDATIDREALGGIREARFAGGVLFLETVDRFVPERELSFAIAAQTDQIPPTTLDEHVTIGGPYFDVERGSATRRRFTMD